MKLKDILYPFLKRSGKGYTSVCKDGILIQDEISHGDYAIFNTVVHCQFFHDNEDGKIKVNGKVVSPWFRFATHPGNNPFEPVSLDDPPSIHIDSEVVFLDSVRFKVTPHPKDCDMDGSTVSRNHISGDNHIFSVIRAEGIKVRK